MSHTFKTPKGTELPLLDLKGKPYLQVMHRILWMREDHPDWQILTEPVEITKDHCLFKATIKNKEKETLATAHGREDLKHFQDYIEKSESKAIGRALGFCGYGTQFAVELEEESRIVDTPATRKQTQPEANKAKPTVLQNTPTPSDKYYIPFGKFKGMELSQIPDDALMDYVNYVETSAKNQNKAITGPALEFIERATAYLNDQLGKASFDESEAPIGV